MFNGEIRDTLLLTVTPLSLGIKAVPGGTGIAVDDGPGDGILAKLIGRNTTIPTRKSEIFTTAYDNQPSVRIQVYQGEREIAAYNKKLAAFDLTGIAPAPQGVPRIEVSVEIDANGIVNVFATDLATGKQQSVQVTGT